MKKCGITSGDVGKNLLFLHMALQIALVHLLPSEKDLTIKCCPVNDNDNDNGNGNDDDNGNGNDNGQ